VINVPAVVRSRAFAAGAEAWLERLPSLVSSLADGIAAVLKVVMPGPGSTPPTRRPSCASLVGTAARFLGLPVTRRANITDIIEAVCGVRTDTRTVTRRTITPQVPLPVRLPASPGRERRLLPAPAGRREPTALNGLHRHINAMTEADPQIATATIWQRLADEQGTTVARYTLRTHVISRREDVVREVSEETGLPAERSGPPGRSPGRDMAAHCPAGPAIPAAIGPSNR
jgi:hypothetical protein